MGWLRVEELHPKIHCVPGFVEGGSSAAVVMLLLDQTLGISLSDFGYLQFLLPFTNSLRSSLMQWRTQDSF